MFADKEQKPVEQKLLFCIVLYSMMYSFIIATSDF